MYCQKINIGVNHFQFQEALSFEESVTNHFSHSSSPSQDNYDVAMEKSEPSLKCHVAFKNINFHFQCLHKSYDFFSSGAKRL